MNLKYNCAPVPTLLPDPLSASMTIVATVWPLANDDPEILGRFFFFFEKWRDGFSVALLSPEWLGAFFLPSLSVADNVHNPRATVFILPMLVLPEFCSTSTYRSPVPSHKPLSILVAECLRLGYECRVHARKHEGHRSRPSDRFVVPFLQLLVKLFHGRGGIVLRSCAELCSKCFVGLLQLPDPLQDSFLYSRTPCQQDQQTGSATTL